MFMDEFNRAYQILHPFTFQSKYAAWWAAQESNDRASVREISDEDLDFGLLILRLCLLCMQCLPHPKYPTTGILQLYPNLLEAWLDSTADELDKSRPSRRPSLYTIQHRFYHVNYLKSYARIRECWSVLATTIKDAHELKLHRKTPGVSLSELEMELRRRTFWSLYVWDRVMATTFGHWPLIPEGYFDIDPPHDNLEAFTVYPYVLTPFSDRVFHVKICRYLTAFMSPPSWQIDQYSPVVVADFAQRFQQVIVDQLPPAFWLHHPDTAWDAICPALPIKRQMLHVLIYNIRADLYKGFVDPCHSLQPGQPIQTQHPADPLALSHRRTLIHTTCQAIHAILGFYTMTADKEGAMPEHHFLLPILLVEALASLGVCLLSIHRDTCSLAMDGIQISPDPHLQYSYAAFFDGHRLLCQEATHRAIAKQGLEILESLHNTLCVSHPRPGPTESNGGAAVPMGAYIISPGSGAVAFPLEHALASLYSKGGRIHRGTVVSLPKWLPSLLDYPNRSWLFQDPAAFGALIM
ncbi:uncharacterized protein N7459_003365 [Penicillium hispanicum]|uniref:uncharacterized protein n=1 Tax=Penicillium hispanicum TaxID=1080232 RepID=UPI002541675B|nr:uncharacterized protein N7459_003365 [Penicillium hispanicum]KAJ5587600.1 hypothetical protein N7459_003365 [Penicillium hispanicum]